MKDQDYTLNSQTKQWFDQLQEKRRLLATQLKDPAAVGLWKSVIDKYADNAHFVYELLQNSDDVEATEVRVYLYDDRVEYVHNGAVRFSLSDPALEGTGDPIGHINAITSIGSSSKKKSKKIGKFGVGFKSVFKYTNVPHVEDDNFSFDLQDYIVPVQVNHKCPHRCPGETAFLLPLNNRAYLEVIEDRFKTLHNPLLCLYHLQKISVYRNDILLGSYDKTINREWSYKETNCREVLFNSLNEESTRMFQFSQTEDGYLYSCSLFVNSDGSLDLSRHDEPLYCFFPTMEPLSAYYIVHAPFLLTESRESLIREDAWNEKMVCQTGHLLVNGLEALTFEKNNGGEVLVDVPVLQMLSADNNVSEWQKIHRQAVIQQLISSRVFLTSERSYVDGSHFMIAEHPEVVTMFPSKDLSLLLPERKEYRWLSTQLFQLSSSEKDSLLAMLNDVNISCSFSLMEILRTVQPIFLQGKSMEELISFYTFLERNKRLWKSQLVEIRQLPLYLCQDGVFRKAFTDMEDLHPDLFLSEGCSGGYIPIHQNLVAQPNCRKFFESIGLEDPGLLSEIVEKILPLYINESISPTDSPLIQKHLRYIYDYYDSLPPFSEDRKIFVSYLVDVPLLPVVDCKGNQYLKPIRNCYLKNSLLSDFLRENPNVFFFENKTVQEMIVPEKRDGFYDFLAETGLHYCLFITEKQRVPDEFDMGRLELNPLSLRQTDNGGQLICDKVIEGVEEMMMHLTPAHSVAFFKLLDIAIKKQTSFLFRLSLEGTYQYFEKGKRIPTQEKIRKTTAIQQIFHTKWLYGEDGQLYSPLEIKESNQLKDIYDWTASDLLFLLDIKVSNDMSKLSPDQREAVELVLKYKKCGLSITQMDSILKSYLNGDLNVQN